MTMTNAEWMIKQGYKFRELEMYNGMKRGHDYTMEDLGL